MKAAPPTLERALDGRIAQASTHRELILATRLAWAVPRPREPRRQGVETTISLVMATTP